MKIQLNAEVKDTDMGSYIDPTTGNMYPKTQFSEIKDAPSKSISEIKAQFEKLFRETKSVLGCNTLDIRLSQKEMVTLHALHETPDSPVKYATVSNFDVVVNINIS